MSEYEYVCVESPTLILHYVRIVLVPSAPASQCSSVRRSTFVRIRIRILSYTYTYTVHYVIIFHLPRCRSPPCACVQVVLLSTVHCLFVCSSSVHCALPTVYCHLVPRPVSRPIMSLSAHPTYPQRHPPPVYLVSPLTACLACLCTLVLLPPYVLRTGYMRYAYMRCELCARDLESSESRAGFEGLCACAVPPRRALCFVFEVSSVKRMYVHAPETVSRVPRPHPHCAHHVVLVISRARPESVSPHGTGVWDLRMRVGSSETMGPCGMWFGMRRVFVCYAARCVFGR